MTDTNSGCSGNGTTTPTIIEILDDQYPDYEPVVRYSFPRAEAGPKQEPILRSIHAPVPEGSNWVSAIYIASDSQLGRLDEYADNPYANPAPGNIAKTVQNECEDSNRVLYSVHAESDAHEDKDGAADPALLPTMINWLQKFVRKVITINSNDCTFYYSGNRSIHVHCPLFVTGDNLRWLKEQTKLFCDETGAELDATVYKRKQQFRLPGAVHQKNGRAFQKVEIETGWNRSEIVSAAAADVAQPVTYAEVLETIYSTQEPNDLSKLLLSSSSIATESHTQSISVLSTWPSRYLRPQNDQKRAYDAKEFYPYRTGEEYDGRSVASIRVVDEPFQRRAAGQTRTFIPCFFYGAHSCRGREYTKDQHYAPLQLSKTDAQKWDYEEGENIFVIGGGNYKAITHKVGRETAEHLGDVLDPDDGDRDDALDYLRGEGYDVGSAGPSQPTNPVTDQQPTEPRQDDASPDQKTDAKRYKERAERGSIEMSLEHSERRKVANRLLTIGGWDYTWNWFKEQYGEDFDPQRTWQGLQSVIETFSEDFIDVEVPTRPQP